MKKNWKVRFRKIMDKEWTECSKPFQSEQSAQFFASTIQITAPNLEAEAFEEASNGSI
jgi:hypothetical protein